MKHSSEYFQVNANKQIKEKEDQLSNYSSTLDAIEKIRLQFQKLVSELEVQRQVNISQINLKNKHLHAVKFLYQIISLAVLGLDQFVECGFMVGNTIRRVFRQILHISKRSIFSNIE